MNTIWISMYMNNVFLSQMGIPQLKWECQLIPAQENKIMQHYQGKKTMQRYQGCF